jgi:hypothetical protein
VRDIQAISTMDLLLHREASKRMAAPLNADWDPEVDYCFH